MSSSFLLLCFTRTDDYCYIRSNFIPRIYSRKTRRRRRFLFDNVIFCYLRNLPVKLSLLWETVKKRAAIAVIFIKNCFEIDSNEALELEWNKFCSNKLVGNGLRPIRCKLLKFSDVCKISVEKIPVNYPASCTLKNFSPSLLLKLTQSCKNHFDFTISNLNSFDCIHNRFHEIR